VSISELIPQLNNQVSLLKALVDSHAKDLKDYPTGDYSLVSLAKLEYCYNNLLTVNDILARPTNLPSGGEAPHS
jgi:hypothetical protein